MALLAVSPTICPTTLGCYGLILFPKEVIQRVLQGEIRIEQIGIPQPFEIVRWYIEPKTDQLGVVFSHKDLPLCSPLCPKEVLLSFFELSTN